MALEIGFASDLEISHKEVMDFYSKHWLRPIALSDKLFNKWQS